MRALIGGVIRRRDVARWSIGARVAEGVPHATCIRISNAASPRCLRIKTTSQSRKSYYAISVTYLVGRLQNGGRCPVRKCVLMPGDFEITGTYDESDAP